MSPHQKATTTAYHEAGHVRMEASLLAFLQGTSDCEKYICLAVDSMQAYLRITEQQSRSAFDDAKAFAFYWTHREAAALDKDARRAWTDSELAAELWPRLMQWQKARLTWHQLLRRKECPELFFSDSKMAEAAEMGVLLGDQNETTSERLLNFIKKRNEIEPYAYRLFLRAASQKKPSNWRHPELDSFLVLTWPIVERFNWSYLDILNSITKKFPSKTGYPFESAQDIGKHCRSALQLRTANKARSPRRHKKPPLFELALEIDPETEVLRELGF